MRLELSVTWIFLSAFFSLKTFAQPVNIDFGWIRLLPPSIKTTAAFVEITNSREESVEILGAKSSIASRVEIHRNYFKDGLMHMEKLERVLLEPTSSMSMASNGIHIMLIDLRVELAVGQRHELCLVLQNEELICRQVEVLDSLTANSNNMHLH